MTNPPERCSANCELFGRHAAYFESHVVPLWQGVYDMLVDRAAIGKGSPVLDIGTGTGEVAIRAARLVGKRGHVLGVDTEEGMINIAREKAARNGLSNLEFKRMSFEKLDLPSASVDSIIGNYSVCCCQDYDAALSECNRVLKPGGRLTFNQSGTSDPIQFELAFKTFEKYQTTHPSKRLRDYREANLVQKEAVERYRDPFVTLAAMREAGFRQAEAYITQRVITYNDWDAFLDRMLNFSWRNEAAEIEPEATSEFKKKAVRALVSSATEPGYVIRDDMVFYTGIR